MTTINGGGSPIKPGMVFDTLGAAKSKLESIAIWNDTKVTKMGNTLCALDKKGNIVSSLTQTTVEDPRTGQKTTYYTFEHNGIIQSSYNPETGRFTSAIDRKNGVSANDSSQKGSPGVVDAEEIHKFSANG